ncbi:MAG TPA: hypothetical protein VG937_11410 [Polyangiaceae bacterium]|nr:hypothetical protein [Polyangiaceae bacterium]
MGIWDGNTFDALPEELDIDRITALNDSDEAVGNAFKFYGYDFAPFLYSGGEYSLLAKGGEAYDINNRGEAIGTSWVSTVFRDRLGTFVSRSSVQGVLWSRECPLLCCP